MDIDDLWGGITLPEWNLERFFALFQKYRSRRIPSPERDEFSKMLMHLVGTIVVKKSWRRSLAKEKLEPEEAAATVLRRMFEKIDGGRVRMKHPCPLVLMKIMDQSINRELISVVRSNNRKTAVRLEQGPEDYDQPDARHESPMIDSLRQAMADAEAALCPPGRWIHEAYRRMCASVLAGNHILPMDKLPRRLQDKITADDHGVITFRLNQLVNRFAADLG